MHPRRADVVVSLLTLAVLSWTGCSCGNPDGFDPFDAGPSQCGAMEPPAFPARLTAQANGELLVAGPVRVRLYTPDFGMCPPSLDYPALTETTVAGPDGSDVPTTTERDARGELLLRFDAALPGAYAVRHTFTPDPRTGRPPLTITSGVHVARDRRDAGQQVLPRACQHLVQTGLGTFVCDGYVVREGVLDGELVADGGWTYVASEDSVWGTTRQGEEVARWVDHGAGPLTRFDIPQGAPRGDVSALVPTGDDLLVRRYDSVEHHRVPTDGGLPVVLSTSPVRSGTSLTRLGDGVLVDEGLEVCPYRLTATGLVSTGSCLTGTLVSLTGDGELMWRELGAGLTAYVSDGGVASLGSALGPGWSSASFGYPGAPAFLYDPNFLHFGAHRYATFPVVEDGAVTFADVFDHGSATFAGGHRDFFWSTVSPDGGSPYSVVTFR